MTDRLKDDRAALVERLQKAKELATDAMFYAEQNTSCSREESAQADIEMRFVTAAIDDAIAMLAATDDMAAERSEP